MYVYMCTCVCMYVYICVCVLFCVGPNIGYGNLAEERGNLPIIEYVKSLQSMGNLHTISPYAFFSLKRHVERREISKFS